MIEAALIILACAFAMRWKGGGFAYVQQWIGRQIGIAYGKDGDPSGPLSIPQWLVNGLLGGKFGSSLIFAIIAGIVTPHACLFAPLAYLLSWNLGVAPPIGDYLGAVGGYKGRWRVVGLSEWLPVDWLVDEILKIAEWIFRFKVNDEGYATVYGWLGSTLRGAWLGVVMGIAFHSLSFVIAGALMAPVYWFGISIEQFKEQKVSVGWPISEWLYGAALGVALAIGT